MLIKNLSAELSTYTFKYRIYNFKGKSCKDIK